jgi:hypothetical protein
LLAGSTCHSIRTVSGYTATQGPNEQPYIIDLYAAPDNSINLPIDTLPLWFCHMLTSPGGDFHILQTIVADTNNWGLAREITCYWEIDDDVTVLAVKIKEYQHNLDAAQASLMLCESHLMLTHATECVEPLHNVARKTGAIHSGWKRTNRRVQSTYV